MKNKNYNLLFAVILFGMSSMMPKILSAQFIGCCEPLQPYSTGVTSHNAELHWYYPTASNCNPAGKFKVRYKPSNSASWTIVGVVPNALSTYSVTINNLLSGTSYTWQVRTICESGGAITASGWTAQQTFTTTLRLENSDMTPGVPQVRVYPNPAQDVFWIETAIEQPTNVSIFISDLVGNNVESFSENADGGNFSHSLNISDLSSGIYFVTIMMNDQKTVSKLVKQ